ncbi:MAG TPA: hypothetical protein VGC65_07755 [Bacteroidia bacterium]|jgi:hypothetical protein
MKYYRKRISFLLLFSIGLIGTATCQTKKTGNPYLDSRERPSDKQRKEERRQLEKGTKAYAKQMEANKKDIQGNINKATKMKKRYRGITKNRRFKRAKKPSWRF